MILLLLLVVLLATPAWAIEEFTVVNLQSQAIADGAGSVASVVHYGTVGLDVSITNTATVTFQGRSTGGQSFRDVRCINTATGTVSATATSSGNYQCPIAGLMELKTPISDCASCIVSVSVRMTTATIAGLAAITASGSDGSVLDGVNAAIDATVKDYANSNPLTTIIVDTNGDPASLGGGTQYTEDAAAAADPVGTQTICRRRDALSTETTLDGDNTAANCTGKGELYVKHVDAVPVTDNGGSLTVDGTVTISCSVTVTDGAGALNVIGQKMCAKCHKNSAQAQNWNIVPSKLACGACHDGMNFTTGRGATLADKAAYVYPGDTIPQSGHVGGAQTNDAVCTLCHNADSIKVYHRTVNLTPHNPQVEAGLRNFTYEIAEATVDANNGVRVKFRILAAIAPSTQSAPVVLGGSGTSNSNPLAGFTGSPSFLLPYALPQDGVQDPADYNNLKVASYQANASNAQPRSVSIGSLLSTLGAPDASGYDTVTIANA